MKHASIHLRSACGRAARPASAGLATFLSLVALGCGGDNNNNKADAAKGLDAKPIDGAGGQDGSGSGSSAPVNVSMNLTGGANGLWWDAATNTLFLTDSEADTLVKYTDAGGLAVVATLPPDANGISLGNVLEDGDGNVLTPDFGFGSSGTIFEVAAGAGSGTALTGLDPLRRRIGLAVDPNGQLYSSYFEGGKNSAIGGVAKLTIGGGSATEVELAGSNNAAGFKKIVGVAATADHVYVSDQSGSAVFAVDPTTGDVTTLASGLATADLLFMMPNGDLLTGGSAAITRITQAGVVSTVDFGSAGSGFSDIRGIAYDPANKRIFFVDHSSVAGTPDVLHILPLAQ
jgi:hypothetical protein|nr:hypothetical protein [Kofleriaceae bacterium]